MQMRSTLRLLPPPPLGRYLLDFGFSDEQELLREQIAKVLADESPLLEVRRVIEGPTAYSLDLWKRLAEMGVTGLLVPETFGGAGLGWVDLVVVLEETGRSLLPSPLLSHNLVVAALCEIGSEAQRQKWLPRLAEGSAIGAVALLEADDDMSTTGVGLAGLARGDDWVLEGEKHFVSDVEAADLFIVSFRGGSGAEEVGLALVEGEGRGVSVKGIPRLDRTKPAGTLELDGVVLSSSEILSAPSAGFGPIARLGDLGALAVSAETIGVMEAILALTAQYAKERVQFGSPIGRFQGVKHPLAELHLDIECLKSLVYYAAWALDASPAEVPASVAKAKAWAAEAVTRAGITGIQLHGAVGYTEEYDIQLYLKRSKWARPAFGDEVHHYDRVAEMGGL